MTAISPSVAGQPGATLRTPQGSSSTAMFKKQKRMESGLLLPGVLPLVRKTALK